MQRKAGRWRSLRPLEDAGDLRAAPGGVVKHRRGSAAREAMELDGAAGVEEETRFNQDLLFV